MGAYIPKSERYWSASANTCSPPLTGNYMLILEKTENQRLFSVKLDPYYPLRIEFDPPAISIEEVYYWRSTNCNYLLETKLHANNGSLAEICLVLMPDEKISLLRSISNIINVEVIKIGFPRFQLDQWLERIGGKEIGIDPALRRYDENRPFQLFIANDGIALVFDGFVPSYTIENNQRMYFLFNTLDELCGLAVKDEELGRAACVMFKPR
jgi:hypothetical protein